MSYDLGLYKDGKNVYVKRHQEGETYVMGGLTTAQLNITWNYGDYFYQHLDEDEGLRWLYGKTGVETTERLEKAVAALGTDTDEDYWASTPGNAGHALNILLGWAKQHPDAVWDGD